MSRVLGLVLVAAVLAATGSCERRETPSLESRINDRNGACPEDFDAAAWQAFPVRMRLAKNLRIEPAPGGRVLISIEEPWPGAPSAQRYLLEPCGAGLEPAEVEASPPTRLGVPVRRVVTTSSPQVGHLVALGRDETIVGVDEHDWINAGALRQRIEAGLVAELGEHGRFDVERLVQLDPELLLVYDYGEPRFAAALKLEAAGIPYVFYADYLEPTPLAQAEWIKLTARLTGDDERAASLFDQVLARYRELASLAAAIPETERPRILVGAPYQGAWWVAGGKSHVAQLIRDAGGRYLWQDDTTSSGVPLGLESALERAVEADLWIHPSAWRSLEDGRRADPRFAQLSTFEHGRVWNNNNRTNGHGGNEYWEVGAVRPDLMLADLVSIFHPDLLPDHELVFYRRLE